MAKIINAKGRRLNQSPSGYTRLFGDAELGNLLSRIQGTVISSGTELEHLIWERSNQITDLVGFITHLKTHDNTKVWVANKNQIRDSKYINSNYEPDFLFFDLRDNICYVVEVKDGDQFDTKKSHSEHTALHGFTDTVRYSLPLDFQIRICCFNANTKEEIYTGLKRKFSMSEILTGRELCDLLGIEFDDIINTRKVDQAINLDYFVKSLLNIRSIRSIATLELSKKDN